jgi:hypothetical protein
MAKTAKLDELLRETQEIESFLHTFLKRLPADLKPGEDVTRYVKKFGLKLPASLKGEVIEWVGKEAQDEGRHVPTQTIVLSQPGQADALGLTIKCITIRGWRFCLECGWFYCRIVITKRF